MDKKRLIPIKGHIYVYCNIVKIIKKYPLLQKTNKEIQKWKGNREGSIGELKGIKRSVLCEIVAAYLGFESAHEWVPFFRVFGIKFVKNYFRKL